MTRRIAAIRAACALAALLAGCASTPSHLYTLSSTATLNAAPEQSLSKLSVFIGPVSIPAVVDLQPIVVRNGPNQVWVDQFNRWASPLRNNISLVVAENVTAILGTSRVSSVMSPEADYRVAIDVQIFDSAPGDAATLSALWSVRRVKDGKTQTGRSNTREATLDKSYAALAAAHSRALNHLSADIADAIRTLNAAE
jgi:uncharacterized lipoprotein YmbA